ncbi:hypothetical protein NMG60_11004646 [Bertholletia excelsa]
MHCEGCARKVRKCLKGFEGVENVQTDCKAHKVVVKGEKADPLKVLERVQRKSHRQVELLSPIPKPPAPEESKKAEEKEPPKAEEKKEEPQVITVVLKVYMHCDACAQEIKRRILRMNGVENVEADLKSSLVTVRGVFETPKLVEYLHKRTGKNAVIVKQEPEKKEEEKGRRKRKRKRRRTAAPAARRREKRLRLSRLRRKKTAVEEEAERQLRLRG